MKFEYKVFDKGAWWRNAANLEEQLNKFGEEGWKLMYSDRHTFIFMREKHVTTSNLL